MDFQRSGEGAAGLLEPCVQVALLESTASEVGPCEVPEAPPLTRPWTFQPWLLDSIRFLG
jgi:hypothetical protein